LHRFVLSIWHVGVAVPSPFLAFW